MSGEHRHTHAHGHGHGHTDLDEGDHKWLALALAITLAITLAEVAGGLLAGSLALLSDAAHNVTDAASLALALMASRLAMRPASPVYTFGWKRSEIISAQVNGAALVIFGGFIAFDASRRLLEPSAVEATIVIALGLVGGGANLAAAWALSRAQRQSLNVAGAMQHVLADLFGSIAAVIAGLVVLTTGFERADPLAALVVVALMLRSGYRLLRDSGRILLEGTPHGMDTDEIGRRMVAQPCVYEVHDLHVWEVTSGFPALSAHVLVGRDDDCHRARRALEGMLHDDFGIDHTTLQVDHAGDTLLSIDTAPAPGASVPEAP